LALRKGGNADASSKVAQGDTPRREILLERYRLECTCALPSPAFLMLRARLRQEQAVYLAF
jgi:hypothetical protein